MLGAETRPRGSTGSSNGGLPNAACGATLGALAGGLLGHLAEAQASNSRAHAMSGSRRDPRRVPRPYQPDEGMDFSTDPAAFGYANRGQPRPRGGPPDLGALFQQFAEQVQGGGEGSMRPAQNGWIQALPTQRLSAADIA